MGRRSGAAASGPGDCLTLHRLGCVCPQFANRGQDAIDSVLRLPFRKKNVSTLIHFGHVLENGNPE